MRGFYCFVIRSFSHVGEGVVGRSDINKLMSCGAATASWSTPVMIKVMSEYSWPDCTAKCLFPKILKGDEKDHASY